VQGPEFNPQYHQKKINKNYLQQGTILGTSSEVRSEKEGGGEYD
jgi:hypothetical protein